MHKSIYVIGPTSSGKSDLAISLAKEFAGEIVGCDSRQIYRFMDIGTGKEPGDLRTIKNRPPVTKKVYVSSGVAHHLIDSHHPNTDFSAGKFVKRATRIIADIHMRGKTPIICGGTLFWAQALLEGDAVAPVKPNTALRKKLSTKNTSELLSLLEQKDPIRANNLIKNNEINNKVRLIRSIEIATELGHVPPVEKKDYTKLHENNLIIAIQPSKEILHERIKKRLNKRLDQGMLDEVYNLHHSHGVAWSRLESFGLEYKWCALFLRGKITKDEFSNNLLTESFRYAKRQQTWIRRWERSGATIHSIKNLSQAKKVIKEFHLVQN